MSIYRSDHENDFYNVEASTSYEHSSNNKFKQSKKTKRKNKTIRDMKQRRKADLQNIKDRRRADIDNQKSKPNKLKEAFIEFIVVSSLFIQPIALYYFKSLTYIILSLVFTLSWVYYYEKRRYVILLFMVFITVYGSEKACNAIKELISNLFREVKIF
ncbi:18868_t:CDS:1 [Dentiscutata erythropus]|uniref:18868_t:CDS:1 n=1 Tax=Dentiscutata erythropus TaxID=1348616 RepID=A0A9N9I9V7_9GLOM|nr:18868_t:CDS:1 [Dentiscutata erythropus]